MTRRAFAIIALVWLASTLLWLQPGLLIPDGAGYYAWLPSTHLDRDLLFFDEWQRFGLIRGSEIRFKDVTPTDHLSNHWTAGSAMVWYPAFLLGSAAQALLRPGTAAFVVGWSAAQKLSASGAMALAVALGVFSYYGIILSGFDFSSALLAIAYWWRIRR